MADYSFEEHFGQQIPSFPPREVLAEYIFGRAKKHDLKKHIQFSTAVRNVAFDDATSKFTVMVEDLTKNVRREEVFDYVVVASGHFSIPHVPTFEGIERFPGRVMHAHDFRDAEEFKGKRVLIVGASYSAEDIGLQIHKYGAKSVTMTYRTAAMGFKWPETMEELPLLQKLQGNVAHFKDGQTREIDSIILCTGCGGAAAACLVPLTTAHAPHIPSPSPTGRVPALLSLPVGRAAPADHQPPLPRRSLQGRRVEQQPAPDVHWHAGPMVHLHHVRCAGLAGT